MRFELTRPFFLFLVFLSFFFLFFEGNFCKVQIYMSFNLFFLAFSFPPFVSNIVALRLHIQSE